MKVLWNTPAREKDEYYGERFSAPLVAYNKDGQVLPYMVRWDFNCNGWVVATFNDGPNASDYPEVNEDVDTWMDPQIYFSVRKS